MEDETQTMLVVTGIMVIIAFLVASYYLNSYREILMDSRIIAKNTASTIYALLLEISSSEQGYSIYTSITPKFTVNLTDSKLVVVLHTPSRNITYHIRHNISNVVSSAVTNAEELCVVKKILNCTPYIMICDASNKSCCNIGENIC